MKTRKVMLMIEIYSCLPIKYLRDKKRVEVMVTTGDGTHVHPFVRQVKANVIKEKK